MQRERERVLHRSNKAACNIYICIGQESHSVALAISYDPFTVIVEGRMWETAPPGIWQRKIDVSMLLMAGCLKN